MRTHRLVVSLFPFAATLLLGATASAQDEEAAVTPEFVPEVDAEEGRTPGWSTLLGVGSTVNLSDNRSVIGQTDGANFNFGFNFDGAVDYNHEEHEWRNRLGIKEGLTQTPQVDELVKTTDNIDFETIYLYHVTEWFGPFARFALSTSAFRGHDVRPDITQYDITTVDGGVTTVNAQRLTLTDPLLPLRLKESVGPFLRPLSRKDLNLEIRTGIGARQTFADDQLAITDDDATEDVIEVTELQDNHQLGWESALEIWGDLQEGKASYRAGVEFLVPFVTSELPPEDDRNAFELTTIEVNGALSFRLVEWASLDYELKVLKEPLLLDEYQIQNNLLLTFGAVYSRPEKTEE